VHLHWEMVADLTGKLIPLALALALISSSQFQSKPNSLAIPASCVTLIPRRVL
jgi:hypothetical protein